MGCFGYYRRFIASFSQIAEPLFVLLRKGEKFIWTDKQQRSFDILKNKLATAPVLALPCDDAQTILDVDASDTGLGAVLSHVINGEERPIAYASRKYNACEKSYCITRRELLSLVFGLKHFRQYCLGRHVIVRTDHAPLLAIKSNPNPSAQMCRWIDLIEEMDIAILHRPGIRHGNAEGCSRAQVTCHQCKLSAASYLKLDKLAFTTAESKRDVPLNVQTDDSDVHSDQHDEPCITARRDCSTSRSARVMRTKTPRQPPCDFNIIEEQQYDPDIKPIYDARSKTEQMPDWASHLKHSEDTKNLLMQWPLLTVEDNILYRRWIDGHQNTRWWQCVIPFNCREKVLQLAHT